MNNVDKYSDMAIGMLMSYGPKLLLAIATLCVGLWLIRIARKLLSRAFSIRSIDASLQPFLLSLVGILLKTLLVISVAGMVGIEVTSFIAILGAAGLAVGMALSDTLKNFAGGVMILIFKPFQVGNFIEAQGFSGTVREIQIFNTILATPDNKIIIIPNAPLSNAPMINYSREDTRRITWTFGISYDDSIEHAKTVLRRIIDSDERILREPEPFIAVSELADNSVNIVVRAWAQSSNYGAVLHYVIETVKNEFDKEKISFPYPQRDVYLKRNEAKVA